MAIKRVVATISFQAAATLALFSLLSPSAQAQPVQLSYFKNYFVTGDYAVGGVGLGLTKGSVSSAINFSGVPCTSGPGVSASVVPCSAKGAQPADVIAAFLYWQTIENSQTPNSGGDQNTAAGYFNDAANTFNGIALGNPNVAACVAGGNGNTRPKEYTHVYRADVLRFLPINNAANVRVANGTQSFTLNSSSPQTQFVGASLVVVYRLVTPGNPYIAPLRSVVIYDGAFTGTPSSGLAQTMVGLVQASSLNPAARMTHVVGNGQKTYTQTLTVNGSIPSGVPSNPFNGAQGPNWDNYSFNYSLTPGASSVQTSVVLTYDCLSWAAIVTSASVQDSDYDGIPDVAELYGYHFDPGVRYDGVTPLTSPPPTPATFGNCQQYPNSAKLPNNCLDLPHMGANVQVPDIFVQVDWMFDPTGSVNLDGTAPNPPHSHAPQIAALNMVGAAFKAHGINVHFDVGNDKQPSPSCQGANGGSPVPCSYQAQNSPYVVPGAYAHGGNAIDESPHANNPVLCPNQVTQSQNCVFQSQSSQFSVLGWKFGFDAIRDGDLVLGFPQLFQQNEKDTFHYALFGHALAATTPFTVATTNPPEAGSISGVADHPGGDILVTLGLWRSGQAASDEVGTLLQQAGTLMHELGHNLGLGHGGWYDTPTCMPDYPSSMNYLYQTLGLTDAAGNEHIDYSYGRLSPLAENALSVNTPMGPQSYRVRYFGPFNPSNPNPIPNTPTTPAQAFCSGGYPTSGQQYVRLEWPSLSTPDWSNGTVASGSKLPPLDINYDGTTASGIITNENFTDSPDWFSLNLQQVSARAGAQGFSSNIDLAQVGLSQYGLSQYGLSQYGLSQYGLSQYGLSQYGATDFGTAALGQDALGDSEQVTLLLSGGSLPPTGLGASVYVPNSNPSPGGTGIALSWTASTSGLAYGYNVYFCNATTVAACTPTGPPVSTGSSTPSFNLLVNDFTDAGTTCPAGKICYNTPYNIYVTELFQVPPGVQPPESGQSNIVPSEVYHAYIVANAQPTVTYGATTLPFPAPTYTQYPPNSAAFPYTAPASTCVYSSAPRNAGTYSISCSGPSTITSAPAVGVTYNLAANTTLNYPASLGGSTTQPTLTINKLAITVTATQTSKVYDGTTNSTAPPTVAPTNTFNATFPPYGDTKNFSESYDSKDVTNPASNHTMTPAGNMTDGVSLASSTNYTVNFVSLGTPNGSTITAAIPLTITASPNTKTYDGTTSAAAIPTTSVVCGSTVIAGPPALCGTDTISSLAETYTSPNASQTATLTVSAGYIINDGNGGKNYSVTLAPANGIINPAPVKATAGSLNGTYNGTAQTPSACVVTTISPNTYSGSVSCTNSPASETNAGSGTVTPVPAYGGDSASNFAVTLVNGSWNIAPAPVTATAGSYSGTYDGMAHSPSACAVTPNSPNTYMGAASCTNSPASETNAGSGTVTPVPAYGGDSASNFAVTLVNGSWNIAPAPVTATAGSYSGTYDGSAHSTSACVVTATGQATFTGTMTCSNNPASVGPNASPTATAVTPVPAVGPGDNLNNYAITSVNGSWSIAQASSTTTVTCPSGPYTYTGSPLTPCSATVAGAGGLSLMGLVPTYSNNKNAGLATASYTFAGDSNHTGSNNSANFTINPAPVSVVLTNLNNQTYTGGPLSPNVFISRAVTYTLVGAPDTEAGSYLVSATVMDPNYIGSATGTFVIKQAPQTITFNALSNMAYSATPFNVTATATSGLAVTFTATGNCTVTPSGSVTLTNIGTCNITAAQAGNGDYLAATSVTQSFTVTTAYTKDSVVADFTNGITTFGTFTTGAFDGGVALSTPWTPSATDVSHGTRIIGNGNSPALIVMFPSAVSRIRVFPSIDHFGASYDGYQYTISGSNDNVTYTPLYDVTAVSNSGEPFTLVTFTGQGPFSVNNVLTPGAGSFGTVGYVADFNFSQPYQYYKFGASSFAVQQLNSDQELTAVAALP